MLCRGLADSGLSGLPAEYYNINQRVPLAERWEAETSATAYTAALSLWIALHRGVWAVRRGTEPAAHRAPVPYDYDGIERVSPAPARAPAPAP